MKLDKQIAMTVAGMALLAGSISALAAVPVVKADWGSHDSAEFATSVYTTPSVAFSDIYTFSLASLSNVLAVAVANDAPPYFDISGGKVELFSSNGDTDYANDTSLGSFTFDAAAVSTPFSGLAAGNYFYRVTGNAVGVVGGSYLLSSAVTPVPEADTGLMMLIGLGVLGFIARRRSANS